MSWRSLAGMAALIKTMVLKRLDNIDGKLDGMDGRLQNDRAGDQPGGMAEEQRPAGTPHHGRVPARGLPRWTRPTPASASPALAPRACGNSSKR